MASSKFRTEVKERNPGEPCFVVLNTDQPIGLASKQIILISPLVQGLRKLVSSQTLWAT